ncbi:MAG: ATP-binding cassette domain-containing protein [Bacteroidetes bacterium]|jgi:cell division transport system ATP-binding protein|nr:ATP-binding cassette domain-containing protein [Bacteroidota bacterium]MBT6685561.1 ATP-binding cassette domain-containing protein [Bacteroidota bacterium]MBT7141966.1 ATP-binding cassette domain-containing protein [Bacteroidota bacterium]MBT7493124.1 ATP-binding cassette domain-containing protein [Bacteroidota bacterium]
MQENTIIKFKNASIYQKDELILSDVNLEIKKGEFVYFIGKVGSGKSSLLKTMYADLPLGNGEASVAGFNLIAIKDKQLPYLRRKIGFVFQDFQLLTDRNVYENLNFVLKATAWKKKSDIKNRISEVLEKVEMLDKINKMPHELSGGEQQRIVIARALLNNPEIILADEPTGNLDPKTSEGIMKLLFDISNNNRAVLMATHDYMIIEKFYSKTMKCTNKKLLEVDGENVQFEL